MQKISQAAHLFFSLMCRDDYKSVQILRHLRALPLFFKQQIMTDWQLCVRDVLKSVVEVEQFGSFITRGDIIRIVEKLEVELNFKSRMRSMVTKNVSRLLRLLCIISNPGRKAEGIMQRYILELWIGKEVTESNKGVPL